MTGQAAVNLELTQPEPGIRVVTVARPAVLNAVDRPTLESLASVLEDFGRDETVRVVILTGQGEKAFVAGSDLKGLAALTPPEALAYARLGHKVGRLLADLPAPTIAAVNGFALGSGTELALCCDLIFASETAVFGLPEVGLGLIPGHGGTVRLTDRIGSARAREWIYSGRRIPAEEAERIGLVQQSHPREQLMEKTLEFARGLAARSRPALAAAKRLLQGSERLEERLEAEARAFAKLFGSHDQVEGVQAFLEKRPPRFS